ncbi:hypothetical protein [Arthrobacter sp. NPDC056727]|uniref:hypothetical protein n=1 Tax=Arthrobacter sp. NPDC056727 TaxID=3345927 RepID=UPI003671BD96
MPAVQVPYYLFRVGPVLLLQTSFPELSTASGKPELPRLQETHPASGQVIQMTGPLDDRFVFETPPPPQAR